MPFPQKLGSENDRLATKRPSNSEHGPLPDSFDDDEVYEPRPATNAQSSVSSSTELPSFITASNKEIKVKQSSLDAARKKLRLDDDLSVYSQWIERDLDGKNAVGASPSFKPTSFGFQTAGCKPIGVSEAAMHKARKLLESAEEESENLASFIPNPAQNNGLTAINSKGFVSPFMNTQNNPAVASPVPSRGSPNRFRTPFRPPSFVSPLVTGKPETLKPSATSSSIEAAQRPATPTCSTPLNSAKFGTTPGFSTERKTLSLTAFTTVGTPTAVKSDTKAPVTPVSSSTLFGTPTTSRVPTPGTPATPASNFPPLSLISLSQAENFVNDARGIDVIGLVDSSPVRQKRDSGLLQISFLLRDDSVPSIKCDLFRRSDPGFLNKGDVVLLRRVLVKRIQGRITLNAVVKSGLEVNPDCPEADRFRGVNQRRNVLTPVTLPKESKKDDEFSYSDLKCIDRLRPEDSDAIVKGHIHEIKRESLTYLGCIKCKRKIQNVDDFDDELSCVPCGSTEGRHFFAVKAQIYDFSGILKVTIFDDVFARLIEEDAEDMSHLEKYNPDALNEKLFSVEYAKPRLFRLRRREDDWVVEDFKEIDYTAFNEFLGAIIKKKGYPLPKFPQ